VMTRPSVLPSLSNTCTRRLLLSAM
jgi:hypothetical protein